MISNPELRARARQNLGGSIFHNDWLTALAVCFIASAVTSVFPLILAGPMNFGLAVVFLKKARTGGKIDFGDLFTGFDIFGETLVLGLMQMLIPFLWGLIPIVGVIFAVRKSYSFAMAMYIKADNPQYDWRECLDRSTIMMEGHRWELFCLQFSFLGWILLGALACGLGILWVMPYMQAATANFYEALRLNSAQSTYFTQYPGANSGNAW